MKKATETKNQGNNMCGYRLNDFDQGKIEAVNFIKSNLKAAISRIENITKYEIFKQSEKDEHYLIKLNSVLNTKRHILYQVELYEQDILK